MTSGKSRVIIENVQPSVDNGAYAAKRTVGERVDVTANIFGDGHDHIRASVMFKKETEKNWSSVELLETSNDEWAAAFHVLETGRYVFTVHAWIDHFDTWYDGFKKKASAKLDVYVELQEGAIFLKALAKGNKEIAAKAKRLEDKIHYHDSIDRKSVV